VAETVFADKN